MDVDILLWAVVKFRNKILSMEGFDPFVNSTTAASLAMNNYLGNYLKNNKIMVNKNYTENKNNYSVKSLKWLTYLEELNNKKIISAFHGLEQEIKIIDKINNKMQYLKVDGYDRAYKIVY